MTTTPAPEPRLPTCWVCGKPATVTLIAPVSLHGVTTREKAEINLCTAHHEEYH